MSKQDFETAEARGRALTESTLRAISVDYDPERDELVVSLQYGCEFRIPIQVIQTLHDKNRSDIWNVVTDGLGLSLHWPSLDVDLFVPSLLQGRFGTRAWMRKVELAQARPATTNDAMPEPDFPPKTEAKKTRESRIDIDDILSGGSKNKQEAPVWLGRRHDIFAALDQENREIDSYLANSRNRQPSISAI